MSGYLKVSEIEVAGKKVLVRADLEWPGENSPREIATLQIIKYLQDNGAEKIKVIGHKGRLAMEGVEVINEVRQDEREMKNDMEYAKELGEGWEVYINEAFASSHREHTSVSALPKWMKEQGNQVGMGRRFEREMENLDKAREIQGKKVLVIGGAKGDKTEWADKMEEQGYVVLRGGLLEGAGLREDGLDISDGEIERFKKEIEQAEVIVVAGPAGKYEEVDKGTKEVFSAVANSLAYKIAGGGDTEAALAKYGFTDKFNWISVGGGAMLTYLATGALPGLKALLDR